MFRLEVLKSVGFFINANSAVEIAKIGTWTIPDANMQKILQQDMELEQKQLSDKLNGLEMAHQMMQEEIEPHQQIVNQLADMINSEEMELKGRDAKQIENVLVLLRKTIVEKKAKLTELKKDEPASQREIADINCRLQQISEIRLTQNEWHKNSIYKLTDEAEQAYKAIDKMNLPAGEKARFKGNHQQFLAEMKKFEAAPLTPSEKYREICGFKQKIDNMLAEAKTAEQACRSSSTLAAR
jgi:hypothetical protein